MQTPSSVTVIKVFTAHNVVPASPPKMLFVSVFSHDKQGTSEWLTQWPIRN